MSANFTASWRRDAELPFQKLDEETIVVDPRRREVHLLNETAARIWDTINGVNLRENIEPTRERARLILKKGPDHEVRRVLLRKL